MIEQPVTQAVIADLKEREQVGIKRYGRTLGTFNGRSALLDAYEEVLDLAQYIKQVLMEDDALRADNEKLRRVLDGVLTEVESWFIEPNTASGLYGGSGGLTPLYIRQARESFDASKAVSA
jgi:hypothetical protein